MDKELQKLLEDQANEVKQSNKANADKMAELSVELENLKKSFAEKDSDSLKNEIAECKSEILKISRNQGVAMYDEEKAYNDYMNNILRKNRNERAEFVATNMDLKTQGQTGTDSLGGYAVPFKLESQILKKESDVNIMRRLCSSQTVSTPDTHWNVDLGGTATGWVGELTARSNTDVPTLDRIGINWGEIYANPKASYRLLDDAGFNVEAWYSQSVAEAFGDKCEEAFLTGDGTNKPKGILSYTFATTNDSTRAFQTFQNVAGSITADSIIDLYYSLRQVYRGNNTCWLMNPTTIQALRKLKDKNDNYLWIDNVANGMAGTLLGRPVYESRFMPTANTAGNKAILFGDFKKAYTIFDLHGLRIVRDVYTDKTSVQFYTSKRVGNMVKDSCAVKCLTISA